MNEEIVQQSEALKPLLSKYQNTALVIGLLGVAATAVGFTMDQQQFYQSYLLAFLYWISLTMGSLAVLMIHHLAGGRWGFAIRRLLEAGSRTFPLMVILFIPIILGMHNLYEWTHEDIVKTDEILMHKKAYLNESGFLLRAAFCFVIWGVIVFLLNRWSTLQDKITETYPTRRMQRLSAPGILIFALTMTIAAVDWIMSLEPHWFSTMFALIYLIGQILLTWAFMILIAVPLSRHKPLDALLPNERLRDLGTFMLGFVLLWTYTSFSQFLIIWGGNLPEEIPWYVKRVEGAWQSVAYLLLALHFIVPFLLLISSRIKARTRVLVAIAAGLVIMRLVDLYWITAPAFQHDGHAHIMPHWLDLAAPIGIGGIWFFIFFSQLKRRSLIALNDPRFEDLLSGEGEHSHG